MLKRFIHLKLILFFVLGFLIQKSNAKNCFNNDFEKTHFETQILADSNFSKSDIVYVCSVLVFMCYIALLLLFVILFNCVLIWLLLVYCFMYIVLFINLERGQEKCQRAIN
jgi:hypothetical protein